MLNWIQRFNIFCLLDSNSYSLTPHTYDYVAGAGCVTFLDGTEDDFSAVDAFLDNNQWTFAHLSYNLGLSFHSITSVQEDRLQFPAFFFFKPEVVLYIKGDRLHIVYSKADEVYQQIMCCSDQVSAGEMDLNVQHRGSKEAYLQTVKLLQDHIRRGDCYEINFCQEFFSERAIINPAAAFQALSAISPNPFSAFYKLNDRYLMCASPERFLNKQEDRLVSQPMKGTARRVPGNTGADNAAATELYLSEKDRSENVMVVDLVRNDLSIVCKEGTVVADELFGIQTFPGLHQMVSTVSGTVSSGTFFSQIIKATFPMGSMTGAPKQSVMQLIDRYEKSNRGIFSGSVGYISPNGDFDFNVIIRSMMYNALSKYFSYQVGSGITTYSDVDNEWEECLLKAEGIRRLLTATSVPKEG
ncbi:MAG: anthranilate synthase component I family protein, partial [Chitinophagaceae bacterium]